MNLSTEQFDAIYDHYAPHLTSPNWKRAIREMKFYNSLEELIEMHVDYVYVINRLRDVAQGATITRSEFHIDVIDSLNQPEYFYNYELNLYIYFDIGDFNV